MTWDIEEIVKNKTETAIFITCLSQGLEQQLILFTLLNRRLVDPSPVASWRLNIKTSLMTVIFKYQSNKKNINMNNKMNKNIIDGSQSIRERKGGKLYRPGFESDFGPRFHTAITDGDACLPPIFNQTPGQVPTYHMSSPHCTADASYCIL